jgi:hypothetical protein
MMPNVGPTGGAEGKPSEIPEGGKKIPPGKGRVQHKKGAQPTKPGEVFQAKVSPEPSGTPKPVAGRAKAETSDEVLSDEGFQSAASQPHGSSVEFADATSKPPSPTPPVKAQQSDRVKKFEAQVDALTAQFAQLSPAQQIGQIKVLLNRAKNVANLKDDASIKDKLTHLLEQMGGNIPSLPVEVFNDLLLVLKGVAQFPFYLSASENLKREMLGYIKVHLDDQSLEPMLSEVFYNVVFLNDEWTLLQTEAMNLILRFLGQNRPEKTQLFFKAFDDLCVRSRRLWAVVPFYTALARQCTGRASDFKPQDITDVAHRLARNREIDVVSLTRLCGWIERAILAEDRVSKVNADLIVDIASMLSDYVSNLKLQGLNVDQAEYQAYSKAAGGMQMIDTFLQKVSERIKGGAPLNPNTLTSLALAFSRLEYRDDALFDKIAAMALDTPPGKSTHLIDGLSPHQVIDLSYAFANLGIIHEKLFDALWARSSNLIKNFNAEQISNLLWAFNVAGIDVNKHQQSLQQLVDRFANNYNPKDDISLSRMYYFYLHTTLHPPGTPEPAIIKWPAKLSKSLTDLKFREGNPSALQENVYRSVKSRYGETAIMERQIRKLSVDIGLKFDKKRKIAIEVDGPQHFARNVREPLGYTLLRQRLLKQKGWDVVSIPHWEWERLSSPAEKRDYLNRVIPAEQKTPKPAAPKRAKKTSAPAAQPQVESVKPTSRQSGFDVLAEESEIEPPVESIFVEEEKPDIDTTYEDLKAKVHAYHQRASDLGLTASLGKYLGSLSSENRELSNKIKVLDEGSTGDTVDAANRVIELVKKGVDQIGDKLKKQQKKELNRLFNNAMTSLIKAEEFE